MTDDDHPGYVCQGCRGTGERDGGEIELDKVRETNSIGSARVLARIHRIKTGHDPAVRRDV